VKDLSFAEAFASAPKLPVPLEPSHLRDLSIILGPSNLSGLTRASSGLRGGNINQAVLIVQEDAHSCQGNRGL